jgi:hypothetical protein
LIPKPGIRAGARSGFRSLFHRPKKANARILWQKVGALREPRRPVGFASDCVPSGAVKKAEAFVSSRELTSRRNGNCGIMLSATFHQTRALKAAIPAPLRAQPVTVAGHGERHCYSHRAIVMGRASRPGKFFSLYLSETSPKRTVGPVLIESAQQNKICILRTLNLPGLETGLR